MLKKFCDICGEESTTQGVIEDSFNLNRNFNYKGVIFCVSGGINAPSDGGVTPDVCPKCRKKVLYHWLRIVLSEELGVLEKLPEYKMTEIRFQNQIREFLEGRNPKEEGKVG